MVNIIINDGQNDNLVDYQELTELVNSLKEDNQKLIEKVIELTEGFEKKQEELITKIDSLNNEISILKKNSIKKTNTVKINNPQKPKKQTVKNNPKDTKTKNIYIPNKQLRTNWEKLELQDNGDIINHGFRKFKLPVTLNDLLYIIECDDKGNLKRSEAKRLMKQYMINTSTFGKLIWNIRETKNFDSVLTKYKQNLQKARFTIKDGNLCVNKVDTNISVKMAIEWIQILVNASKKQAKILELQKANPSINPDMIRIVCDSYDNPKLNKLLKENSKKKMFVENNPSKRRNIIANGGLI